MNIKVEKNVPLPKNHYDRNGLANTMRGMDVGDSFVYELCKRSSITGTATLIRQSTHPDFKVKTQKINDDQLRIWRTA